MGQTNPTSVSEKPNGSDLFRILSTTTMRQLEDCLISAQDRREKAFYRLLLNFKLQMAQEAVVEEELL